MDGKSEVVTKTYRLNPGTRLRDRIFETTTRLGVGAPYRHVLTVRGRKTGQLRSTPVDVMDVGGTKWLVASYGPVNWVKNVRASGEVQLNRGGRSERDAAQEVGPGGAVPVLRKYMTEVRVTRPYFDATPESPDEVIDQDVKMHRVFRLQPLQTDRATGT